MIQHCTFWDSEEAKEHNAIAMCSPDAVVYITNRKIDGPVLVVSCGNRYSSFITTEDNRAKHRAMGLRDGSAIIS
jgi:hypothetical protein